MTCRPVEPTVPELLRARQVLAEAFADDPLWAWLFAGSSRPGAAIGTFLGLFLEAYVTSAVADGVISETDELAGVALWRNGAAPLEFAPQPQLGELLVAFVGEEAAGARGMALRELSERHPSDPHDYLNFLAVDPARHGRGLGRLLVQHGQERAATRRRPVFLESTNPRNRPFYAGLGFREIYRFELGSDGPDVVGFWWESDAPG